MPCHGSPSSGKSQRLAASRHASSVASPTARWSAWLTAAALTPGEVEVHRDHDVRAQAAKGGGEVAAQRHAVLECTVGMAEELDLRHPDDLRAPTLLLFTERPDVAGLHAVDPRLAARGQHVDHVLALARPPGDRARRRRTRGRRDARRRPPHVASLPVSVAPSSSRNGIRTHPFYALSAHAGASSAGLRRARRRWAASAGRRGDRSTACGSWRTRRRCRRRDRSTRASRPIRCDRTCARRGPKEKSASGIVISKPSPNRVGCSITRSGPSTCTRPASATNSGERIVPAPSVAYTRASARAFACAFAAGISAARNAPRVRVRGIVAIRRVPERLRPERVGAPAGEERLAFDRREDHRRGRVVFRRGQTEEAVDAERRGDLVVEERRRSCGRRPGARPHRRDGRTSRRGSRDPFRAPTTGSCSASASTIALPVRQRAERHRLRRSPTAPPRA